MMSIAFLPPVSLPNLAMRMKTKWARHLDQLRVLMEALMLDHQAISQS
jgi:hypothetical protein